ncbi:MAG: histidinol-phosphate transaminase [Dehalococcoidia bacterium]
MSGPKDDGLLRLARRDLVAMPGYEPVEPPDVIAAELGIPEGRLVKLDGNENPYGPSPRVLEALGRYGGYHIYPDPDQRRVREAIAGYVGADSERIIVGNGSDELLDLVGRLLLSPGDRVVNAPPTFGIYEFVARTYGAGIVDVPRREDFALDLEATVAALRAAKLMYLSSPNNPTGNRLSESELEALLDCDAAVVVDEAYAEFAGASFVPLTARHDNLIVTRTFSKWAGLAGLRAGYAVLPPAFAETVRKIKMPYNMNVAAQTAVLASLEDREALLANVDLLIEERERMAGELAAFPWLRVYPSQANFLLCQVQGRDATEVQAQLRKRGVLVRHYDSPGVRGCLRISAGRPQDTDRVMEALSEIGAAVAG